MNNGAYQIPTARSAYSRFQCHILSCKLSNLYYYYSQKSGISFFILFFKKFYILRYLFSNRPPGYSFLTCSKFWLFKILDFHFIVSPTLSHLFFIHIIIFVIHLLIQLHSTEQRTTNAKFSIQTNIFLSSLSMHVCTINYSHCLTLKVFFCCYCRFYSFVECHIFIRISMPSHQEPK